MSPPEINLENRGVSARRGPPPRRCYAAGRYDVTAFTRSAARERQGGAGWRRVAQGGRTEECVHTPGTEETEDRL